MELVGKRPASWRDAAPSDGAAGTNFTNNKNDMEQKYIQLSLFDEDNSCDQLCPSLTDVIAYFTSINKSIDPEWWDCRWSDMIVYTKILRPNQIPKGCMASGEEYPFNVWEFIKRANKDEFINAGIAQVKSGWTL